MYPSIYQGVTYTPILRQIVQYSHPMHLSLNSTRKLHFYLKVNFLLNSLILRPIPHERIQRGWSRGSGPPLENRKWQKVSFETLVRTPSRSNRIQWLLEGGSVPLPLVKYFGSTHEFTLKETFCCLYCILKTKSNFTLLTIEYTFTVFAFFFNFF